MDDKGLSYDHYYMEDSWAKFLWEREQMVLLNIVDTYLKDRDINFLDFACGTGRISSFFENRVSKSVGVDVSPSMLRIAREKLQRTELLQADLTRDNVLQGRKFNLITAFRFFLNAEPKLREEALRVIVTLLAEDGYFVFNNHQNLTSPSMLWSYCRVKTSKNQSIMHNFMSVREMKNLVIKSDLKIIKIYPVGLFNLPRIRLPKLLSHKIENISMRFKWVYPISESPIVVCRHSFYK